MIAVAPARVAPPAEDVEARRHTNERELRQPDVVENDWLEVLCRQIRWNERELLDVLADISPTAPSRSDTGLWLHRAARREEVRRHVDDAIAAGELDVTPRLGHADLEELKPELRAKVADAVYASALYDRRYTVAPAIAIEWFLSRRRALFQRCRLLPAHLAIAQATEMPPPSLGLLNSTAEQTPSPPVAQALLEPPAPQSSVAHQDREAAGLEESASASPAPPTIEKIAPVGHSVPAPERVSVASLLQPNAGTDDTGESATSEEPGRAAVLEEVGRRAIMLADYKMTSGVKENAKIYKAARVHKPEFQKWQRGVLSRDSAPADRLETFLKEKRKPSVRS